MIVIAVVVAAVVGVFNHRSDQSSDSTTLFPTTTPSPVVEPSATSAPTSSSHSPSPTAYHPKSETSNWIYPNSKKLSDNQYETSDSPETVTDWYKAKIRAEDYSTRTFVATSANSKVFNKLSAAKNNQVITIQISRNPESSQTLVALDY